MNCKCGVRCFMYQTLEPAEDFYQRVLIYSCGMYISDGKKKTKCDFYNKKILKSGIIIDSPSIIKKDYDKYIQNEDLCVDKKSRKDIESNIHLLKIGQDYQVNISNYVSLINYNLRKLQYKPFFPDKESVDSLIKRLDSNPDDIRKIVVFPTKSKPKCKPKSKPKCKVKKTKSKYEDIINSDIYKFIDDSEESDVSDVNENDNDNENESYVSDIDYDTFDDEYNEEEAFSD